VIVPGSLISTLVAGVQLPKVAVTISANVNNFNLFTAAGSPTLPVEVTVTINGGIVVGSTSTAAAFVVPAFPAGSIVNIINNGYITGIGGNGGPVFGSAPGLPGGLALSLAYNTNITNNGVIQGGGGGGGSAGGVNALGGGGAGTAVGVGNNNGTLTTGGAGFSTSTGAGGNPGLAGVAGNSTAGGAAGAATSGAPTYATWLVTGTRLGAVN
jgi:hypothetical protein